MAGRSSNIPEVHLGRVIHLETAGKERTQLTRSVVLALRELLGQSEPDSVTRDLAAYISLALQAIYDTIDPSVEAWEKRGYWLKADRFRMEWAWTNKLAKEMRQALLHEDWQAVALVAAQVGAKLRNVELPARHRLGTPWVGAWEKLNSLPET
jgi:hypothetical protein